MIIKLMMIVNLKIQEQIQNCLKQLLILIHKIIIIIKLYILIKPKKITKIKKQKVNFFIQEMKIIQIIIDKYLHQMEMKLIIIREMKI